MSTFKTFREADIEIEIVKHRRPLLPEHSEHEEVEIVAHFINDRGERIGWVPEKLVKLWELEQETLENIRAWRAETDAERKYNSWKQKFTEEVG